MTLAFLNPSRSFDVVRNAIRFTGHDGMFEVRFFVEADALTKLNAELRNTGGSEKKHLAAFDASRASIHEVASGMYSRSRRDTYVLTANDFS